MGVPKVGNYAANLIQHALCEPLVDPATSETHSNLTLNVHSLYKSSGNLQIGNQLIYIGAINKGMVPFGLHFSEEITPQILYLLKKEQQVKIDYLPENSQSCLIIGNQSFTLSLDNTYEGAIATKQPSKEALKSWLKQVQGLSFDLGLDLSDEIEGCTSYVDALFLKNYTGIGKSIFHYLGRGKGLTPSGDDFLIGLMAADQLFQQLDPFFYLLLDALLVERKWTTDVSNMYLASASGGEFSLVVKQVIESLTSNQENQRINQVIKLTQSGSTSGWDTLAGIYVGVAHYIKENKE